MKNVVLIIRSMGKISGALAAWGLIATIPTQAQSISISTVAGYAGYGFQNGISSNALFSNPQDVALDSAGNLYVADSGNNTIRVITPGGISSTLAGRAGVSGSVDGTGTNALFNQPSGIVLDSTNGIYVTDYGNNTIRKITTSGAVTTIAGTAGVAGSGNATGTNATFFHPMGIAVDGAMNLYVADYGNQIIRKISSAQAVTTYAGLAGTAGYVDTGSGTTPLFNEPEAVAVDAGGSLYVADTGNGAIRKVTSGGVVTTLAGANGTLGSLDGTGTNALFWQPAGIAVDGFGTVYVSDYFNNNLRKISSGVVTTLAGLAGTTGSTDGTNTAARFSEPQGLAINAAGTLFVADSGNSSLRMVTAAGTVTTLAGSPSAGSANGAALSARFYNPRNVVVDASANIYVADTENSVIRKITATGVVSVFAGTVGGFGSQDGQGTNALFSGPQGLALDTAGNVYVADSGNNTIRVITPSGFVSTLAGLAGNPGNADGTGTAAQFNEPKGVAVDSSHTVYVADTWNHTIRKITSAGVVTTLAGLPGTAGSFDGTNTLGRFNCPTGIAVDSSGNLYVTDYYNNAVRKVTPAQVVTTIAGFAGMWGSTDGTGISGLFLAPTGISIDTANNLYVADSGNSTIRKLTQAGTNWTASTVAGLATVNGSSDGIGTAAEFLYPAGVTVSGAGYVYVADSGNNTIRSQPIPPVIVTQPQSQTNAVGSTAIFTVTVSGSSPLTYTWTYNGINLQVNSSSLVASNAGSYLVTVSNSAGYAVSSPAVLTLTNTVITGQAGVFQGIFIQPNSSVQLALTGTANATYTLDFSTNLITWTPLVTFTMTNGAVPYNDAAASHAPARFYRLVSP